MKRMLLVVLASVVLAGCSGECRHRWSKWEKKKKDRGKPFGWYYVRESTCIKCNLTKTVTWGGEVDF